MQDNMTVVTVLFPGHIVSQLFLVFISSSREVYFDCSFVSINLAKIPIFFRIDYGLKFYQTGAAVVA